MLALCLQFPGGGDEEMPQERPIEVAKNVPENVLDMEFTRIQEEWLWENDLVLGMKRAIALEDCKLVRKLGCPSWMCRDEASAELRKRGLSAIRIVFWGTKEHDQEIVLRSKNILNRMYACQHCKGTGRCPACGGSGSCQMEHCNWTGECRACDGAGDYRFWVYRDTNTDDGYVKVRRDMFREKQNPAPQPMQDPQ